MKIMLTCHRFLPDHSAGTEILTLDTARALRDRGHEVLIFTGSPRNKKIPQTVFDRYIYDGLEVERYTPGSNRTEISAFAEYDSQIVASYFRTFLQRLKPDIVHFFHFIELSASIVDICVDLSIPTVFTPTDFWIVCPQAQLRLPNNSMCQGPDSDGVNCFRHVIGSHRAARPLKILRWLPRPWLASMLQWFDRGGLATNIAIRNAVALLRRPQHLRAVMNRIDRVMAPTQKMIEVLRRHGLAEQRIRFSRFGINLLYSEGLRKTTLNQPVTIGFIGTLMEHKGAHVLIEAFHRLPTDTSLQLKIYGHLAKKGKQGRYVRRLRRLAGVDPRIEFQGTFLNPDIGKVLSGLDVLCVPSVWFENTPLVIYSAFAAGVPVIATNLGGMAEVIEDGRTGFLFPAGDVAALHGILMQISQKPDLLLERSANIHRPKSIDEYADELCSVYSELVETRKFRNG